MRGVTCEVRDFRVLEGISTRTPHAGSDRDWWMVLDNYLISTRTPHAGSDISTTAYPSSIGRFQPALPMRGVTLAALVHSFGDLFQPALPMRGVTTANAPFAALPDISTRTPHAGSDVVSLQRTGGCDAFQPALPMRGVTSVLGWYISHLLRFQPALPMRGVTAHGDRA